MILAILLMNAGTLHKAFGIPDGFVIGLMMLSALCWLGFFREMKKAKDSRPKTTPPPLPVSPKARRLSVILIFGILIISCATSPFLLRFAGVNIPPSIQIISAFITFIIVSIIVLKKYRGN